MFKKSPKICLYFRLYNNLSCWETLIYMLSQLSFLLYYHGFKINDIYVYNKNKIPESTNVITKKSWNLMWSNLMCVQISGCSVYPSFNIMYLENTQVNILYTLPCTLKV